MYLSHLALDNYRSYRSKVVEFSPGVTVLVGSNGQGKTNLVEAIAYLATFSSHRVGVDSALVRFPRAGEREPAGAVVRAKVREHERDRIVEVEIVRGRANRAKLNRTQVRPRDVLGVVKTVMFAPEDLALVKGDPSTRRTFLDELAVQLTPAYARDRSDWERTQRQRASLLKQLGKDRRAGRGVDEASLAVWDDHFIQQAHTIAAMRYQVIDLLKDPVSAAHDTVTDSRRHLNISPATSLAKVVGVDELKLRELALSDGSSYCHLMRQALDAVRDDEITRGVNLVGPHRDDLVLTIDDMPVKGFASHGESWSVALALRLGSFNVLTDSTQGMPFDGMTSGERVEERPGVNTPILILDDVFAELDTARRRALLDAISAAEQIFVTTADVNDIPAELNADIRTVTWAPETGTQVEAIDAQQTEYSLEQRAKEGDRVDN